MNSSFKDVKLFAAIVFCFPYLFSLTEQSQDEIFISRSRSFHPQL